MSSCALEIHEFLSIISVQVHVFVQKNVNKNALVGFCAEQNKTLHELINLKLCNKLPSLLPANVLDVNIFYDSNPFSIFCL